MAAFRLVMSASFTRGCGISSREKVTPGGLMRIVLTFATLVQNLDNNMRRNPKKVVFGLCVVPDCGPICTVVFPCLEGGLMLERL